MRNLDYNKVEDVGLLILEALQIITTLMDDFRNRYSWDILIFIHVITLEFFILRNLVSGVGLSIGVVDVYLNVSLMFDI